MEVPSLDLSQFATPPRRTRAADIRRMLPTPLPVETATQDVMVDLYDYNDFSPMTPDGVPISPSRKYGLSPRARYIMAVFTVVLVLLSAVLVAGSFGLKMLVRR